MLEIAVSGVLFLVGLASEIGVVKHTINVLSKVKETQEFKDVISQNKKLLAELREAKKLNKELLEKIDRIHRGE